ncbi:hypothetical protein H6S82_07475 [Planktothrix sp. FACHB-1355]|uniref:Uncharacterized protein n=1 Tax=Aerosakkonema funiforme FACHB-1375 TaxID=2949571 RepID=A0A926ZFF0_9CYAN|nr:MULTISPECIES: hypothetical protein [Oscillatoriales]MBD2181043.1 hypothetical protein [Aerosakkonema funiforme FACHB-1375]MBD3558694.1 hypothetical protein [Planktothrix sp. FACHB-1355]
MPSPSISTRPEIAVTQLTSSQEADLNQWYEELDGKWLTAINDSASEESQELAAMEANWLAEQEYYHDRYLYADRI